ncbi:MAG TPA: hypothetical protein VMM78_11890 [Thermomicrobiales bacterium]|nr:hypothetical protein [Thermomicrobiales bacterium]
MHSLSQDEVRRIQYAEADSFLSLYAAAAERCGTITYESDGIRAVWSPADDDPGFSCVIDLADSLEPERVLADMQREAVRAGVPVIGIDGSPDVTRLIGDERLRELGFVPAYQERFWGRRLESSSPPPPDEEPRVERISNQWRETFARVLNVGYDLPAEAVRGHVFAATIGQTGWTHYLVLFDGEPGAASVLYVTGGVAQLFVTATIPEFRSRGGQTALIRARLADSIDAGCALATSQTVVDNASPRNMARHGFERLYDRWIYGKRLR